MLTNRTPAETAAYLSRLGYRETGPNRWEKPKQEQG